MTALSHDGTAELRARIAELERQLQSNAADNARLQQELSLSRERQNAGAEILSAIADTAGDDEGALRQIAETSARLFGASSVTLRITGGDPWSRTIAVGPGAERIVSQVKSSELKIGGKNLPGTVVAENRQIHLPDIFNVGQPYADFPGLIHGRAAGARVMAGTPLRRDGEAIGALILQRDRPEPFSSDELGLLQSFADQAVIAIENARLFRELQQRSDDLSESLQQQTATSEVLQVISNSSGDLQPVFDAMLANATRICEAKFGMMWLIEGDAARCVALHNAPPAFAELRRRQPVIHPGPDTAMGRLLRTRQVVHVEDAMAERAYIEGDPVRRANADLAGARTIVAVPLLRDNEVIGAIGIFHQEVRPFTDKQIQLVTNFANQAVIAIENARLLNELRHRTAELSRSLEELRAAQDRLVQTEKLASLGQLTAGIAHEIKNPLNFVNNFAALSAELTEELNDVLASGSVTEKIRGEVEELTGLLKDNLQKIVQHGQRADSIVKNMLLHSREGSGEHRPTDVNALVEESLNLAYHGARAEKPQFNVTLQRELDPAAGTAELFPQEITRVLLNLISNGFYAVAKRSSESGEGFEPVLNAATRDRGAHVEILIRDNGTGIPPEVKERMFNPFFTTKPAGQGTGLGLSMSHDIVVKQHGGTIEVDTAPNQFTEFTIRLPRKSSFSDKQ